MTEKVSSREEQNNHQRWNEWSFNIYRPNSIVRTEAFRRRPLSTIELSGPRSHHWRHHQQPNITSDNMPPLLPPANLPWCREKNSYSISSLGNNHPPLTTGGGIDVLEYSLKGLEIRIRETFLPRLVIWNFARENFGREIRTIVHQWLKSSQSDFRLWQCRAIDINHNRIRWFQLNHGSVNVILPRQRGYQHQPS